MSVHYHERTDYPGDTIHSGRSLNKKKSLFTWSVNRADRRIFNYGSYPIGQSVRPVLSEAKRFLKGRVMTQTAPRWVSASIPEKQTVSSS
jgi:hypothetical protein